MAGLVHEDNTSSGGSDRLPGIRAAAREALPLFYDEVRTVRSVGIAHYAVDILRSLGEDREHVDNQWRADDDSA